MINLTPEELSAIYLSLKIALVASLISLPIAIVLGYVFARKNFIFKKLLISLFNLPLVLPPVVTGYILLITFGVNGVIGKFLLKYFNFTFAFKWTGAALACAIMGFPLMIRAIKVSIEMIDVKYEEAAKTLGANRLIIFLTITLPLALPGIIAGFTLCFARSLGEFGATVTFVSNIPGETQTLSTAIYNFLQMPNGELMAMRLTIIAIIISIFSLILSEIIFERISKYKRENN
ncbi:MAG: molybdate ABC transporter permease subunit [Rickettsiales bacterium]|nr:molybdate ABC transporter permease subunit [Rickettsiales bacterium]OUV82484.1 MAG: molybdate ABC transporter permease [Rickettsiales bacterium TMED131]|tara:strand:- start:52 stop:750 length:699 start_codon:yes stop_codon:yes gene_type:complete